MIILHGSDVHFGKPHLPTVADAFVRFVHDEGPDAVVISGDLTQRAKAGEYQAARTFLARLVPCPLVTTPGNHDVPLYRAWERIFAPYRNYRSYIGRELDTVLELGGVPGPDGVRFVALNSSAPRSAIVNGRLTHRQMDFAASSFAAAPAGAFRVLVVHHNLINPRDGISAPPLRGAASVLQRLREWRVDLVLSGHVHQSHFGLSGGAPRSAEDAGVPVLLAGTASSSRGRGKERGRNSFNLIRVEQSGVEAMAYLYSQEAGCFLPAGGRRYPRRVPKTRSSRGAGERGES